MKNVQKFLSLLLLLLTSLVAMSGAFAQPINEQLIDKSAMKFAGLASSDSVVSVRAAVRSVDTARLASSDLLLAQSSIAWPLRNGSSGNENAANSDAGAEPVLHVDRRSEVPEPDGWSMTLLGIGFVVYQIRRRRSKQNSWKA